MRRNTGGSRRPRWGLTAFILGLAVFVVAALSVYRLYAGRVWDGASRFTVIRYIPEAEAHFEIVSFDPVSAEGIILSIPNSLEIETLNGRGVWRVGVLPELAKRFGWSWTADSLSDGLGIASMGFESSLGSWDKLTWWWNTRDMQFKRVDLSETALLEKTDTIDGQKVLGLSTIWDDKAREWFVSAHLVADGKSVRIVNSLGEAGMGTHAARLIEHSGLRVSKIDNDQSSPVDQCEVSATNQSVTTSFLLAQFGCSFKIVQAEPEVVLKLGTAYKMRWQGTR